MGLSVFWDNLLNTKERVFNFTYLPVEVNEMYKDGPSLYEIPKWFICGHLIKCDEMGIIPRGITPLQVYLTLCFANITYNIPDLYVVELQE